MTPADFQYGLFVARKYDARQLVLYDRLLAAAAAAEPPFIPSAEGYLTAFRFDAAMPAHLKANGGSSAGFADPVWSDALHFDLDADGDLRPALEAGRRLATTLLRRYPKLGDDDLGIFYSGGRSFHLSLPLTHRPDPGSDFHAVCGLLAGRLAKLAGVDTVGWVKFDPGNYDRVRLWRLVNSRHFGTGLHKVRLDYAELMGLTAERIRKLASAPRPFDLPAHPVGELIGELEHDWTQAAEAVAARRVAQAERKAVESAAGGPDRLNRTTLEFIGDGAENPNRHRLLFSAAANLAEFDCPPRLAVALLMPAALDSGLAPADALRQIECGLRHTGQPPAEGGDG